MRKIFNDANLAKTLLSVENVLVDVCYYFVCVGLDNTVMSGKWKGLPEKGRSCHLVHLHSKRC
jgi:hypothetical protein